MTSMGEQPADYGASGECTLCELRITNHGKMAGWVTFALDHFEKHANEPLVLHTLPIRDAKPAAQADDLQSVNDGGPDTQCARANDARREQRTHASMCTIPRLVSVVEIIKREYLKSLNPDLTDTGCLSGLYQYNEVGELQDHDSFRSLGNNAEGNPDTLAHALQGDRHLKQKRVAFMRVTLCRRELPTLVTKGATYQRPDLRRLSKSARARMKRKFNAQSS